MDNYEAPRLTVAGTLEGLTAGSGPKAEDGLRKGLHVRDGEINGAS